MNLFVRNLRYIGVACISALIGITAVTAIAQDTREHAGKLKEKALMHKESSFCANNNWGNGDKVSFSELREVTVPSSGTINVDAGKNGGVSVKGDDRSDVLVRACIQAWGATEEAARAAAGSIRVNTGGEIKADGPSGDVNWSVSYQILAPRNSNTNLTAHNGGISISGLDGNSEFTTSNGGVNLSNLAGSVKGRTTNGGVNVVLAGTAWKGSGLDVQTTNGGVNLTMPETYNATVETGTVNGGFKSDIPSLNVSEENIKGDGSYRSRSRRVVTTLNSGGAPIKVITTNGGVKISTPQN